MQPEILQQLYQTYTGHTPESIEPLAGAGSNRKYYRLKGKPQLIGVCGTSETENRAFLYIAKHFKEKKLPVPQVYAQSDDGMAYLQEDLGDISEKLIETNHPPAPLFANRRGKRHGFLRMLPASRV